MKNTTRKPRRLNLDRYQLITAMRALECHAYQQLETGVSMMTKGYDIHWWSTYHLDEYRIASAFAFALRLEPLHLPGL